jgi:hypothetical protein
VIRWCCGPRATSCSVHHLRVKADCTPQGGEYFEHDYAPYADDIPYSVDKAELINDDLILVYGSCVNQDNTDRILLTKIYSY